ncbi:sigma-70 family RNA polymerase sigma factor [Fulvivirgaceae bacterium PWU4]|uniref:Sigma-70 family RNA polymerase sigma factor n=1 Tax=Chryseosolibacter histidini TaxID=2782349 RepID=A0AAP2DTC9_9BACT|nr:sigma-70 family RNA polymerase sigma factor [Chryseosolibacter histidini]MBT1701164.1 sigma-70 family RNA polymerase sigma factor [Chryseosolibacter histidini]
MREQQVDQLVGHLFRKEAGKMAAVLTRLLGFGNLDITQDIVQDTLLKAVTVWKFKGIPDNPSAWLYTVAKRKAIDVLRQRKLRESVHEELAQALESEWTLAPTVNQLFIENEIEDSQLRMIFACCHPAIPYESQIALTLKTLCGLSVSEIARSFLTTDETIAKRLYRAREKIRLENIALEVPAPASLPARLDVVLHTLYLLFNEGYNSSHPDQLIRNDLCEEAMRLCLLLTRNSITSTPRTNALLSLMCLQASREAARLGKDGEMILLKDQDRSLWNKALIEEGISYLNRASEGPGLTDYHLEAAIAAHHSMAGSFEHTNWEAIFHLYGSLSNIKPGPVVEMNKAIALGYWKSAREGLKALVAIEGLEESHRYHAVLGDFYFEVNDREKAMLAYDKALSLVSSKPERELLQKKRSRLL